MRYPSAIKLQLILALGCSVQALITYTVQEQGVPNTYSLDLSAPRTYASMDPVETREMERYDVSRATFHEVKNLPIEFWQRCSYRQLQILLEKRDTETFLLNLRDSALRRVRAKLADLRILDNEMLERIPIDMLKFLNVAQVLENVEVSNAYFCYLFGLHEDCLGRHGDFDHSTSHAIEKILDHQNLDGFRRVRNIYHVLDESEVLPDSVERRLGFLKEAIKARSESERPAQRQPDVATSYQQNLRFEDESVRSQPPQNSLSRFDPTRMEYVEEKPKLREARRGKPRTGRSSVDIRMAQTRIAKNKQERETESLDESISSDGDPAGPKSRPKEKGRLHNRRHQQRDFREESSDDDDYY